MPRTAPRTGVRAAAQRERSRRARLIVPSATGTTNSPHVADRYLAHLSRGSGRCKRLHAGGVGGRGASRAIRTVPARTVDRAVPPVPAHIPEVNAMNDRTPTPGRGPRPVRPAPRPPARVFWMRRLVVLGLPLLLVVALGVWLAGRVGEARADEGSAPTPAASPTPTVDATPGLSDCDPALLALAITPGAESFGAGVPATFDVSVTNGGTEPCLVDMGEGDREVVITSGDDRVWSSRDCLPEDPDARTLLLVGGQSDVTQLAWSRERSDAACSQDLPEPGDGTYSVVVTAGGVASPAAVFGLG